MMSRRSIFRLFGSIAAVAVSSCKRVTASAPETLKHAARLDFPHSLEKLHKIGLVASDEHLVIPAQMPKYDDEKLVGFSIFRAELSAPTDISNLTIPRTYIGRSELDSVLAQNTDLNESSLCWNDFMKVDFALSVLDNSDIRSSNFVECNFTLTSLKNSDLRHSRFSKCIFSDADFQGAVIANRQLAEMGLTKKQLASIDVRQDEGPEPEGG